MPVLLAALALAPATYRAQATAVCARSAAAEQAAAARLSPQPTRAQALAVWPTLLALGRHEVRELRALAVPAALRADHGTAVGALGAQLDLFAGALAAVRAGRTPNAAAAGLESKLFSLVARERAAWRRAGVERCAES